MMHKQKSPQPYNPYFDEALHLTVPDKPIDVSGSREGFNDVIRHADAVQGHQMPRRISDMPNPLRQGVRLAIWLYIGSGAVALIYSLFQ